MRGMKFAIVAAVAAAFVVAIAQGPVAQVGKVSPAWSAMDSKGKVRSLADFKGKYVVLEWFNKDCPFVRKHYGSGNMQATQKKAKEMGAVWLSICSSAPGKQGYFTQEEADNFFKTQYGMKSDAYLLDPEGKVGRMFSAKTTPQIVIFDPKGVVIYNGAIDDKPSADPKSLEGATNYALQALSEAMGGKAVSVPTSQPYGCSIKY